MWKGLYQQMRWDAVRENDGDRMLLHWRFDRLQFFEKHHTKYFVVGLRLVSAVSGAVSPRLQMSLIWNRTVNKHGGHGRNIEIDLQMEFYNKEYKESVKDTGGHLTSATIARHSQMIGVGKILKSVYDKQVSDLSGITVHRSVSVDRQKDIKKFVSLLQHEDLFTLHPGRSYTSFPDVNLHLYPRLTPKIFRSRLEKHRQHLSNKYVQFFRLKVVGKITRTKKTNTNKQQSMQTTSIISTTFFVAGRRGRVIIEKMLKFATGASREPLLGFSMNPTIQFAEVMFPSASTCINQLVLPVEIVADEFFYMAFLNDFFGRD